MRRFGAISGLRARLLPMNPPSTVKPDTRARPAMYPAGYNASAAGDGTEYRSGSFSSSEPQKCLQLGRRLRLGDQALCWIAGRIASFMDG